MVHSFLVYLQLSVGSYLNLWKDLSKKRYNTAMSMKDKKKEKISVLKLWLGIAIGALLSIIGFLATNLRQVEVG